MWACTCVGVCECESQFPGAQVKQAVDCVTQVLGTDLGSSAGTACTFNYSALSAASKLNFLVN